MRKRAALEAYDRSMPRALGWSYGVERFLMSEGPLYQPPTRPPYFGGVGMPLDSPSAGASWFERTADALF